MKKILIFFIVLFVSLYCFAISIEGFGTGSTKEESRLNALIEVSEYITGLRISKAVTEYSFDSILYTNNAIESQMQAELTAYIIPSEFFDTFDGENSWTTRVLIDNRAASLIVSEATKLCDEINFIYLRYTIESDSFKQREYLWNLWEKLCYYESLYQEAALLGIQNQIPFLKETITSAFIRIELISLLNKEENTLYLAALQKQDEDILSKARVEAKKIQEEREILEKLEEIEKKRSEALHQEELQQAINEILKTNLLLNNSLDDLGNSKDFQLLWEKYITTGQKFKDTMNQIESLIFDEQYRIEQEYKTIKEALNNTEYRIVELDSDGNPTNDALKKRELELANLEENKQKDIQFQIDLIVNSSKELIMSVFSEYTLAIKDLQNTRFILPKDCFKFSYLGKDQERNSWRFKLDVHFLNQEISFGNIYISFVDLIGFSLNDDKSNYNNYVDEVEKYTKLMEKFEQFYNLEIPFFVKNDVFENQFQVVFNQEIEVKNYEGIIVSRIKTDYNTDWIYNNEISCIPNEYSFISLDDPTGVNDKVRREKRNKQTKDKVSQFFSFKDIEINIGGSVDSFFQKDAVCVGGEVGITKNSFLDFNLDFSFGTIENPAKKMSLGKYFRTKLGCSYPLKFENSQIGVGAECALLFSKINCPRFDFLAGVTYKAQLGDGFIGYVDCEYSVVKNSISIGMGLAYKL